MKKAIQKRYYIVVSVTALALIITTVTVVNSVSANDEFAQRSERHAEMTTYFENGDYEGWKEAAATRCEEKVGALTEERFALMMEFHTLMESGDMVAAKEFAQENDLHFPNKGKMGKKFGEHRGEKGDMSAIKDAVASGDYEAWKAAVGDKPHNESITAENFHLLLEMHELKQSGDFEAARAIAEELGLPARGDKMGMKSGQRMHQNQ